MRLDCFPAAVNQTKRERLIELDPFISVEHLFRRITHACESGTSVGLWRSKQMAQLLCGSKY